MKKQFFYTLFCCLALMPFVGTKADTVVDGQSTEGKDFWVTFLQADQKTSSSGDWAGTKYNTLILSLSISSREDCQVTIENPFTNYSETVDVVANEMKLVEIYKGHPKVDEARAAMAASEKVCYAVNSEQIDTCALHVTSTANISLFATNYKKATFDATNVLPTKSLLKDYVIQAYTPSDHDGTAQGTHFAIIATEDNTSVTYTPSVLTPKNRTGYEEYLANKDKEYVDNPFLSSEENAKAKAEFEAKKAELIAQWGSFVIGEHSETVTLNKGQVYYVWTGEGDSADYDLSGTIVNADKNIAVFQGSPHTNIPYKKKQRDHIFSQAMPTQYWGNTFALTASAGRPSDIIRIMALNDETTVYINGDSVYAFDFSKNKKHQWEFEIGTQGKYAKNGSCLLTTSCPCAVHLFIVSQEYYSKTDGDPAMLWINPIEQQIDQVTFATYASSQTYSKDEDGHKKGDTIPTKHYVNIVTDKPELMKLDGAAFAEGEFKQVNGDTTYYYAQKFLGNKATSHTLKSEGSNFIAHVYGFTANESYGYSAGGATKPLTQYIIINGEIFTPETENTLCGEDTVKFECHPDYEYEKVEWHFGDGQTKTVTSEEAKTDSIIPHYYANSGSYKAYVLIYRESSHVCAGQKAIDSIPITVTIGRYKFAIGTPDIPCPEDGKVFVGRIPYTNEGHVNLHGDNVTVEFNQTAKDDGFTSEMLKIEDAYFEITIPTTAKPEKEYGIHLVITSSCGGADTTLNFMLNFDDDVITQRYDNVLGLLMAPFAGKELSDFQWYRTSDSTAIEGQITSNLNFYDLPYGGDAERKDAYYVCFTINKGQPSEVKTCACAKSFAINGDPVKFGADSTGLIITAAATATGDKIFVNANWGNKTDIECYAQWINASGKVYQNLKFDIPDGGCTIATPNDNGLYLLRVVTGKKSRSFKFIINK